MKIAKQIAIFVVLLAASGLVTANSSSIRSLVASLQDRDPMKPLQNLVASKTARFETIDKGDSVYKSALDSHDLTAAMKMVGTEGAFKGTLDKLFEERDGDLVVFDFDPNYRIALTAVLKNPNFAKFPVVRDLKGKEILVSGKFVDYHGKAQIELTDPQQIKIVK